MNVSQFARGLEVRLEVFAKVRVTLDGHCAADDVRETALNTGRVVQA